MKMSFMLKLIIDPAVNFQHGSDSLHLDVAFCDRSLTPPGLQGYWGICFELHCRVIRARLRRTITWLGLPGHRITPK